MSNAGLMPKDRFPEMNEAIVGIAYDQFGALVIATSQRVLKEVHRDLDRVFVQEVSISEVYR